MTVHNPQSLDHLAEQYDHAVSLERDHSFFLNNLPRRHRRVLDVGCGTGLLACELSRHFESVTAIDSSEPMLAIARRKRSATNIDYQKADANHLVLNQTFDAIVNHTTFHHLQDIPATLAALKGALEPGGRLILVDNIARWSFVPRGGYIVTIASGCGRFFPDVLRRGVDPACSLFRFRVSRPWMDHLRSDHYFSAAQFHGVYSRELPGASFTPLKRFVGVVWQAADMSLSFSSK
jgi:ubiquinone/menaquinone biosynthesis C-methylase UbiE